MMETKIENQEQYEKSVKDFEEEKLNDFINAKANAISIESFYTKTRNEYNDRMNCLQEEYPLNSVQSFIQDWIYNNNSKTVFKSEFDILELFCKDNEQNLQRVAIAKAEFEALQNVFGKIIREKENINQLENKNIQNGNSLTVKSVALLHVYLAMFSGQPVTQQNKDVIASKYKFRNGNKLRNEFTKFQNEDSRLDLSTINKRAAKEHLQRFKIILPLLEKENPQAHEKAKNDLQTLENKYNKHF